MHADRVLCGCCAGIVYGLYLTLSSWVLFYVATHMSFFHDSCHLQDLNTNYDTLTNVCTVRCPAALLLPSFIVWAPNTLQEEACTRCPYSQGTCLASNFNPAFGMTVLFRAGLIGFTVAARRACWAPRASRRARR
jgi:hypothetical protein